MELNLAVSLRHPHTGHTYIRTIRFPSGYFAGQTNNSIKELIQRVAVHFVESLANEATAAQQPPQQTNG